MFGLAPAYWVKTLPQKKTDKINLTQLNQFRNLLTAGDVSTMKTVSEDNNIHQWLKMVPKMAYSSSVALHVLMVSMAIKMTGIKPVNIKKRILGGKMVSMPRHDTVVSETMAKSPKKRVHYLKQFKILNRMNIDLHYIIKKF